MTDKRKVPEIRFKGFSGEWEEQELRNISDRFDYLRVPITASERIAGKTPYYGANGIQGYVEGYTHKGEFILVAEDGANDLNDYPVQYVTGEIWVNNHAHVLQAKQTIADTLFLKYAISNTDMKPFLVGGGRAKLNAEIMMAIGVVNPTNVDEQSQIGTFFQNLDSLITLHQRKYDKLTTVKKAMLEKMFPKDGADAPEIRFKGFTEKWERRTLGELYSERNKRGNDSLQILSVSIHHGVSSGELDSDTLGKQVRRSEDKSLYKHVYFGDLVLNMMRAWQGAIGVVRAEGMVSPAYITAIPNEHVFPLFMDCCMRRSQMITQMDNLSYGVTDFRKRLYWDSFIRVSCLIPSVSEQAKITDYFQNLDSLITLQQRELDKLKNIKNACLERMFV